MMLLARDQVFQEKMPVNWVLDRSSVIKRVAMSNAEVSQAPETVEHSDFVRAVLAELHDPEIAQENGVKF